MIWPALVMIILGVAFALPGARYSLMDPFGIEAMIERAVRRSRQAPPPRRPPVRRLTAGERDEIRAFQEVVRVHIAKAGTCDEDR